MKKKDCYNVAIVGCGGFAKGTHVPNILRHPRFRFHAAVTARKETAAAIRAEHDIAFASNDDEDAFSDPDVDLVIIATRHHLHADQIIRAAREGKAVLADARAGTPATAVAVAANRVVETGQAQLVDGAEP